MSAGLDLPAGAMDETGSRMLLVAFAGAEGAFAHEACLRFLPDASPVPTPSFAAALDAVRKGEAEGAMLPLENSIAGAVPEIARLIEARGLHVRARFEFPVPLHLLALRDASLTDIAAVASHPMALAQCRKWLGQAHFCCRAGENTAVAARSLARSRDRTLAVIASEAAARIYNLKILARDIHDQADNRTTFGLVAREGQGLP